MSISIDVKRAVYEENDALAAQINAALRSRGIFTINVLGSPGSGKTTLIASLAARIRASNEDIAVIEGDLASDIDTQTLRALGIDAYQIETGGDCHLSAAAVTNALAAMEIRDGSWLFIENIGNLVCPAEFVIGEDLKILVASVTEGSDKPYKYPFIFAKSAACVLTKVDVKEAIGFDEPYFLRGMAGAAPHCEILPLNGKTGDGSKEILAWLRKARMAVSP